MAVGYAAGSSAGTSRYQRYVSSVHARSHFFSSSSVPFWSGYVVFVNGSTPLRGDAHFAASCLQAGSSPPHWARATLRTANGIQRNRQDRKSTRLNSSHGYISYAVFCLKKKKEYTREDTYGDDAVY